MHAMSTRRCALVVASGDIVTVHDAHELGLALRTMPATRDLASMAGAHRFLRPDVPGFWPSKGVVGTSFAWKAMAVVVRWKEKARRGWGLEAAALAALSAILASIDHHGRTDPATSPSFNTCGHCLG